MRCAAVQQGVAANPDDLTLAYSDRAPSSRRSTGASHVASAPENQQEKSSAHGEGEEDHQAAEEACGRRRALHQALSFRATRASDRRGGAGRPVWVTGELRGRPFVHVATELRLGEHLNRAHG